MMTVETIDGANEARLQPVLVGDLTGRFVVPDYQRGYRWGEHEVEQLLDDITEHVRDGGREYYLQPLVVKPMSEGRWELVDGQQRLTTLYLIIRRIKNYLPQTEPTYSLEYETRPGSAEFLDEPDPMLADTNIDYFHMFQASEVVGAWFDKQSNPTTAAMNIYKALIETVRVIWYEAPQEPGFDSRDLFTRLNVGRIPLTDAELVKALLLSGIDERRRDETAAQWDSFERDLRAPEVWAFVTGTPAGVPTHISLLLDTLADLERGGVPPSRIPFATFQTLRESFAGDFSTLWNRVVDLHSLIVGWYEDRDLFHKIGYLIAAQQATFFDLVRVAADSPRSTFEQALDEQIRDSLKLSWPEVESLQYKNRKTSRVLLLLNVETVRRNAHSSERYSFDAHAQRLWTLEHIHAQRSQGLNRVEQWTAWLQEHSTALDVVDMPDGEREALRQRIKDAIPTITNETFEPLQREVVALFSVVDEDAEHAEAADRGDVDTIANLALLSSTDNSVLNNSVFEVKRRHLIELDQKGSFIPVCTRNVFLKYYVTGSSAQQVHFWGPKDREAYLEAMRTVLEPYLLEDVSDDEVTDDEIDPDAHDLEVLA